MDRICNLLIRLRRFECRTQFGSHLELVFPFRFVKVQVGAIEPLEGRKETAQPADLAGTGFRVKLQL